MIRRNLADDCRRFDLLVTETMSEVRVKVEVSMPDHHHGHGSPPTGTLLSLRAVEAVSNGTT
jgi:hypothetical protein